MKNKNQPANHLLCAPEKGLCELPQLPQPDQSVKIKVSNKPIKVVYFTDPICSSCWGIEPQLRKLKLEWGHYLDISYHMGGLLPSWDVYNSGGISKPSDVAPHWEEVSQYYQMPIDGDVWLEDPLHSSYPPSIAFKAAQWQDKEKSLLFLRRIREMLFLEKKNITRWEYLESAAREVGLNSELVKGDYEKKGPALFEQDLELGKKLGIRGFPTLLFSNQENEQWRVYGTRPYQELENAVLKLYPKAQKNSIDTRPEELGTHYNTFTWKEFSVLSGLNQQESFERLSEMVAAGKLLIKPSKNGDLYVFQ